MKRTLPAAGRSTLRQPRPTIEPKAVTSKAPRLLIDKPKSNKCLSRAKLFIRGRSNNNLLRYRALARLLTIFLCFLSPDLWARGRSFPLEATGIITSVENGGLTFTLVTDEPARILRLAVGESCKFSHAGAPADVGIIRNTACVKVSFWSTVFTGRVAVEIESDPVPQVAIGFIDEIDTANRRLVVRLVDSSHRLIVRWAVRSRFVKQGHTASANDLRKNKSIKLSYFSPAFADKYAVRIEIEPNPRL
jgi:hypothetical protein